MLELYCLVSTTPTLSIYERRSAGGDSYDDVRSASARYSWQKQDAPISGSLALIFIKTANKRNKREDAETMMNDCVAVEVPPSPSLKSFEHDGGRRLAL